MHNFFNRFILMLCNSCAEIHLSILPLLLVPRHEDDVLREHAAMVGIQPIPQIALLDNKLQCRSMTADTILKLHVPLSSYVMEPSVSSKTMKRENYIQCFVFSKNTI